MRGVFDSVVANRRQPNLYLYTGYLIWGRGGVVLDTMYDRSRMTLDPCIPTMPGRDGARRVFTDQADVARGGL